MAKKSTGNLTSVKALSNRKEKFRIRRCLLSLVEGYDPIKAFTFPGSEWAFERDLLLTNKCEIVAVERDKEVYDLSYKPADRRIQYLNLSAEDYFQRAIVDEFNFVWLDFMGIFSQKSLPVLNDMFAKGLKDKAIIALTYVNARDKSSTDLYLKYGKGPGADGTMTLARLKAIPAIVAEIAATYGYSLEVLKAERYKEPQKLGHQMTAPMVFFAFEVKKEGKVRFIPGPEPVMPSKEPKIKEQKAKVKGKAAKKAKAEKKRAVRLRAAKPVRTFSKDLWGRRELSRRAKGLFAEGSSVAEISRQMGVSEDQVKSMLPHARVASSKVDTICGDGAKRHPVIREHMRLNNLSQLEMAAMLGISIRTFIKVYLLRWFPIPGNPCSTAVEDKLVRFFNKPIDELFPPEMVALAKKRKAVDVAAAPLPEDVEYGEDDGVICFTDSVPEDVAIPALSPNGELQLGEIWAAVSNLPIDERLVIRLTFGEGCRQSEVARVLGCEDGDIRSLRTKALRRIKKMLRGGYPSKEVRKSALLQEPRAKADLATGASDRHPIIDAYMKRYKVGQVAMAEFLGIALSTFSHIYLLQWAPTPGHSLSQSVVDKLVSFFDKPAEELFPPAVMAAVEVRRIAVSDPEESDCETEPDISFGEVPGNVPTEALTPDRELVVKEVASAVESLPQKYRDVIELVCLEGQPLDQAAKRLGYNNRQRVDQIKKEGFKMLRKMLTDSALSVQ
jgi:DNA-directed RNA polymerase specialized sigma24 family protein